MAAAATVVVVTATAPVATGAERSIRHALSLKRASSEALFCAGFAPCVNRVLNLQLQQNRRRQLLKLQLSNSKRSGHQPTLRRSAIAAMAWPHASGHHTSVNALNRRTPLPVLARHPSSPASTAMGQRAVSPHHLHLGGQKAPSTRLKDDSSGFLVCTPSIPAACKWLQPS